MSTENKTVTEIWGLSPDYTQSSDFLCGVEYEIEGIAGYHPNAYVQNTVAITDDNSLRNGGREFVTAPLSLEDHLKLFKELHGSLVFCSDVDPYTDRTSTHVHVNFKTVSLKKLTQFVKLYILFEPYFFSLVSPQRKGNIFCVPLNHTILPRYYSNNITFQTQKWHKYTAFNLIPLQSQGTIEFRHLQGTGDINVFEKWLRTIKNLYDFNQVYSLEGIKLESVLCNLDKIEQLGNDIFGDFSFPVHHLADTALDVKLSHRTYNGSALTGAIIRYSARKGV